MTELVSLLTSTAACLSAIAAFVVVRQNYKQRISSYKPELVFVKTPAKFPSFDETGGLPNLADDTQKRDVSIPIVNVGLGAARNLRISWRFPVDQVVSSVNRLAQESLTPVYFEYKNGFLCKKSQNEWFIPWHDGLDIDFVLPASIQQVPTELRLPGVYTALGFAFHHFAFKRASKDDRPTPWDSLEFPPLECRLEYSDIGGIRHRVDLLLRMTLVMIHSEGFECYFHSSRGDA